MSRRAATPFDALLGLQPPASLPKTTAAKVVVSGQPVTDVRQIDKLLDADDPLRTELRRAVGSSRNRSRYQRQRTDPETMASRAAREEAARADRQAYHAAYRADPKNKARHRELATAWARRNYHSDPEAARAKSRAWYQANREAILARAKAKRDAKKAAKAATQLTANDERNDA